MVLVVLLHLVGRQSGILGPQGFWGWGRALELELEVKQEQESERERESERNTSTLNWLSPEGTYVPSLPNSLTRTNHLATA